MNERQRLSVRQLQINGRCGATVAVVGRRGMSDDITIEDLKQAIIDAFSGKRHDHPTGAPRPQWQRDMEVEQERNRQAQQTEIDIALGIDRSAAYVGHISKPRRKRKG